MRKSSIVRRKRHLSTNGSNKSPKETVSEGICPICLEDREDGGGNWPSNRDESNRGQKTIIADRRGRKGIGEGNSILWR